MRVVATLATASIVQAEKTPVVGDSRPMNGKFVVPIPEMVAVNLDSSSYVLPVDGGDVTSLAMAQLLVEFPMYQHIVFNPILTPADIADFDLTAVLTPTGDVTRAIVGRGAGPLPTGCVPNTVGVLARNTRVSPSKPGCLITDTIDISAETGGLGADEFMVWWKIYELDTSEDVTSSYGATSGEDTPALRSITEIDQEPSGFTVYLSNDDGATYTQVSRLAPTDFGVYGTDLRLAFRNTSNTARRYVASYAIMF